MILESELFRILLDNINDGVYFVNLDRRITYWNQAAERLTGYPDVQIRGKHCWDNLLMHVDGAGLTLCGDNCLLLKAIQFGETFQKEVFLQHRDGYRIPVLFKVTPIRNANQQIVGAAGIISDNSPRVALMQKIEALQEIAWRDPLTDLGNRRFAESNLQARIAELHRYGWPFGVLFIDIDHFKQINDQFGHDVGDRVLKMVASTLQNNLRTFDLVCRWGGEEFLVIININNEEHLLKLAEKLRMLVEQSSLTAGNHLIRVTVSMGGTLAHLRDNPHSLTDRADQLMYQSKKAGRNQVTIYREKTS
ncbi:MAG TPA: GGDEF domain-containing protein [Bacillota bacterium]|nr:GGDEF domain-containing protein [Bacillota bacterium]